MEQGATNDKTPRTRRLGEVALLFLRLGFTAFGGPAAHTAMMEDEVVRRRGWIDRQHFLDLVAAMTFIPGPNSTELAINLGLVRAGYPGLIVAGGCFIVPAVIVILPIAWAYVQFGKLPAIQAAMGGVAAGVVAVVVAAGARFAGTGIKGAFTAGIAVMAAAAECVLRYALHKQYPHLQVELLILAAAAIAGAIERARPRIVDGAKAPMLALAPLLASMPRAAAAAAATADSPLRRLIQLGLYFLQVGATLYGSGYVLASYLQAGLVDERHWLSQQQLIDSIAVGQITPGPLLTTSTFVGYVRGHDIFGTVWGGVAGALVSTTAIFLPAFAFVAILGPLLPRIRNNYYARGALDGMNAAVVALILVTAGRFALDLWPSPFRIALAAILLVLTWGRVNTSWLLLIAAIAGLAGHAAGIP